MKNPPTLDKKTRAKLEMLQKQQALFSNTPDVDPMLLPDTVKSIKGCIKKGSKSKEDKPEKTIETMFRITSANSQRLSDQADTKSHIMISVNVLIVSVMLAVLVKQVEEYSNLSIPLIMLLVVSLATIAFAILATKPSIPKGSFTQNDLKQKKINLLFFGNFYKMNFEEYAAGMFDVMNDRQFLYLSLLRDIYCQGVVLGRKYRMLKAAYYVFMFGLIISVIAFLIASRF